MELLDAPRAQVRFPAGGALAATVRARARWYGGVLAVLAGSVALRLPYLDVPLSADVGGYGAAAWWWARGDTLYANITITRPQGIFVVFRLIDALGLAGTRGVHLFATLWSLLATVAMLAVATRVWGRAIGLGATALAALALASPALEGYDANAELFMALPLLASLWCALRAEGDGFAGRRGLGWLALAGALGAVALLLKPSGVVALPLALGWVWYRRAAGLGWRGGWRAGAALVGGFALGLAPALAHGLLTAPDRYLAAVLFYRLTQDSLVGGAIGYQLDYFATNTLYIAARLPILLFAPVGLRLAAHGGDRRGRALLALWLATAFLGTALGGNWFLHYYQQLVPPLAVAVALAVRHLLRPPRSPARFVGAALVGLMLLDALWPAARGVVSGVEPRALPEWEPGVSAAAPIAAYLAARTAPDEAIYVAYDHADIYYLARRRPAGRWLYFRELRGIPGAFAEQVARIADPATAPTYIVGMQAFDRWGFDPDGALRAVVARDYALETTIGGMPLYRRVAPPQPTPGVQRR